jgi:ferric-dicitrate binding protein FerR (iron transport regulator)
VAAAASVVLLAGVTVVGVLGYRAESAAGALVATVERSETPGLELRQWMRADERMPSGAELRVDSRFSAQGDALLRLAGGGNLRVARGSTFDIADDHTVRLQSGELYVDIPPGARGSAPFVVLTDAGQFRHLGTQFGVAIVGSQTRLRVREGSVLWQGASGDQTVNAGTEVLMDTREISRRTISTAGRDWTWAETLAPEIEIENRPLHEFLSWFSRETGRKLELTDAAARHDVDTILMHGNVRGLSTMQALAAVMAATTLHYELPEGAIRVSSPRDSKPTS